MLPALIAAGAAWTPWRRGRRVAALVTLAVLAGLGVEWTRAYVARARTHWSVAQALVERGVRPEQVRVGFEWEGEHLFPRVLQEPELGPPFDFATGFPWTPLLDWRYVLRESDVRSSTALLAGRYRPFLRQRPRLVEALPLGARNGS